MLGRSPAGGLDNPLQYSCLRIPMDKGAWWATAQWVTKSQTQLRDEAHKRVTIASETACLGLPRGRGGKESTCQRRRCKRHGLDPWVRKIPWSRKWQLTPMFLPGKSHGQRSLTGYSPWGHKELDTTAQSMMHI